MWILELYDDWYGCPVFVGVFSTPERAEAAYDIVMRNIREKEGFDDPEQRYDMAIEPIQLDTFIDAAMAWIGG